MALSVEAFVEIEGAVVLLKTFHILENSLKINSSTNNRRTASFEYIGSDKNEIKLGNHIEMYDDVIQDYIYRGFVNDIDINPTLKNKNELFINISCVDYSSRLDNVLINEVFEEESIRHVIVYIYNKYVNNEWIFFGYHPDIFYDLYCKKFVFNYISITEAFDYIAKEIGCIWEISTNQILNFRYREDTFGEDILKSNIYEIKINKTLENFRNQQYIKAGWDTTNLQSGEILTPKPDNASKAYFTRYPLAKVPTIYIDNVAVAETSVGIDGIDSDKWFYWSKGKNQINHNTAVSTTLTSSQTVSANYYGLIKILVKADNLESQTEMNQNMIYSSGLFSKIEDVSKIETREEAINFANGTLAKYRKTPETVQLEANCFREVGTLVKIDYEGLTDDDLYFIESMDISYREGNFYYSYKCVNGEALGDWRNFFSNIDRKSSDMLINEDVQVIKLQSNLDIYETSGAINIVKTTPIFIGTSTIVSVTTYVGGGIVTAETLYD